MAKCEQVSSYLHWMIVQIKAERNTLVESSHWFLSAIDIRHFFRLHVALFMINCRFNDAISYCLPRNNKMLDHFSIQLKILNNIHQQRACRKSLIKCALCSMGYLLFTHLCYFTSPNHIYQILLKCTSTSHTSHKDKIHDISSTLKTILDFCFTGI